MLSKSLIYHKRDRRFHIYNRDMVKSISHGPETVSYVYLKKIGQVNSNVPRTGHEDIENQNKDEKNNISATLEKVTDDNHPKNNLSSDYK